MSNKLTPIFYLHIPKTGGQTLATRLASAFPVGKASILTDDLVFPAGCITLHQLLERMHFVERHVSGPVLKEPLAADILTTIREPVAQIASHYLHISREPAHALHRAAHLLSPKAFFTNFGDFLANHQSRYLSSAFLDEDVDLDPLVSLARKTIQLTDRIRWWVPTEAIDEFTVLWTIEMKKHLPGAQAVRNTHETSPRHTECVRVIQELRAAVFGRYASLAIGKRPIHGIQRSCPEIFAFL